jgi:streptogramin lyase
VPVPAAQADPVVAGEFPLQAGTTVGPNNELVAGPDGNIWITTGENSIVKMGPDGTALTILPGGMTQPATGIIAAPNGKLFAAQGDRFIVIDPANPGAANQTAVAGLTGAQGITVGADGNVWLAGTNALVQIPPDNPAGFTKHTVVGLANGSKGMATGSDGLLWIATGTGDIVSATATATPTLTHYDVGSAPGMGGTQDVAPGLNGQVGYVNPVDSPMSVGLISPGGTPQKVTLANTDPFGITYGNDGAYWVARSSGNDLLRLAPDGTITTLTGFSPSSLGPRKITTGPDNTLWTTLDLADDVAKITGVVPPPPPDDNPPPPPPGTAPETTITKAPDKKVEAKEKTGKAKVKIVFSATGTAPSFECTLTKKGKDPKTKACTSPAKYKLKPGKYKFAVAATADGLADESPATAKFKVLEP